MSSYSSAVYPSRVEGITSLSSR